MILQPLAKERHLSIPMEIRSMANQRSIAGPPLRGWPVLVPKRVPQARN